VVVMVGIYNMVAWNKRSWLWNAIIDIDPTEWQLSSLSNHLLDWSSCNAEATPFIRDGCHQRCTIISFLAHILLKI